MSKKILITGGAGFIARHLVDKSYQQRLGNSYAG